MPNTPPKTPGFNEAAAPKGPTPQELTRFFLAAGSNDVSALLPFVMNYPKDASTAKNSEGLTGLMLAARGGYREAAWILIHAHVDLEIGNENDSTALMFASHAGKATILVQLLENGAKVNHANAHGHTALMSAAANGFRNTAEQLLKFNADVTPKDEDGNTALAYAKENGFEEIGKMIETAGAAQAEARVKAAEEARILKAIPALVQDDNTAALKDLEQRLVKAKLTH